MSDMGGIFGLLGVACGVYIFYSWYKMKKTGELSQSILLPKSMDPKKCKDKEAYVKAASPKMLLLGIMSLLYGGMDLFNTYVMSVDMIFWVVLVGLFLALVWFSVTVSKLNKIYF